MLASCIRLTFSTLKDKLIHQSLAYVHKYGWNDRAIHAGCAALDLSPASHRLITPYQLVIHSMKQWNQQALRIIDDSNFQGQKRIRDKVSLSIKVRLEQQLEYKDTWHQAMKLGAIPQNIQTTKDVLWEYSDQIWRRCGDKSIDYNYYSKRILFNTAYATTELFMLTDQSNNNFATWEFLNRRMDDIETFGKGVADVKVVGEAVFNGALSLLSMLKTPSAYQSPIESAKTSQQPSSSPTQQKKN